jgi:hypothetical protein
MYSYEERMRAVELYIKLGKRLGATIRELGYPTKNALKGWHREYERRQDLQIRWECHELCVSGPAHAGFRYGHALKRSSNMIAN